MRSASATARQMRRRRTVAARRTAVVAVTGALVLPPAFAGAHHDGSDPYAAPPGAAAAAEGYGYAVATESPYASAAAMDALAAGGSVIDAAVAAVLDISVTMPESCGLGGGGFLVHRAADGKVQTLDFREVAGAEPYSDGVMNRTVRATAAGPSSGPETGHDVIGVPGTLAGLVEMHDRLGRLPWPDLFTRALHDARGYKISAQTAASIGRRHFDLGLFEASRKAFLRNGLYAYRTGEVLVQPDLEATLRRLSSWPHSELGREFTAQDALREFYDYGAGTTARLLAAEFENKSPYHDFGDDSPITRTDLAAYRPEWRAPVVSSYHGHQVYGMPPPSSGGVAVAQMLNLLAPYDLAAMSRADSVHLLAEVQKIAYADRKTWMGDPIRTRIPVEGLASAEYADVRRAEIDMARAKAYKAGAFEGYVMPPNPEDPVEGANTTNISIVGPDGEAAALTCTIETIFGSAVVAAGTGIMLNGELHDFDSLAHPKAANAYAPGTRPRSSMSPTIVVKGGLPVLVAGSQGGSQIPTAVLQTILAHLDGRLGVQAAIERGRVHAPGPFYVERVPVAEQAALLRDLEDGRGHKNVKVYERHHPGPPTVTAVTLDRRDSKRAAANDQRRFYDLASNGPQLTPDAGSRAVGQDTHPGSRQTE